MATLHVLRVFTDEAGDFGNELGVFLAGGDVAREDRQNVAARLGFSETVFLDDAGAGVVDIRTPASELPFAGHPLVGTSWLLREIGRPVSALHPPAGEVATWSEAATTPAALDTVWIRARPEWAPDMDLRMHPAPDLVDRLDANANTQPFVDHWAWIRESSGLVRSRVFAPVYGIVEDQATGAAATRLVAHLQRPVVIRQGEGSLIEARPGRAGTVEVGGRVAMVETREDPAR